MRKNSFARIPAMLIPTFVGLISAFFLFSSPVSAQIGLPLPDSTQLRLMGVPSPTPEWEQFPDSVFNPETYQWEKINSDTVGDDLYYEYEVDSFVIERVEIRILIIVTDKEEEENVQVSAPCPLYAELDSLRRAKGDFLGRFWFSEVEAANFLKKTQLNYVGPVPDSVIASLQATDDQLNLYFSFDLGYEYGWQSILQPNCQQETTYSIWSGDSLLDSKKLNWGLRPFEWALEQLKLEK